MRKYLLPEQGRFYKANLHSHSTVSDGEYSPKELKEMYKQRGYSIIAYTDHNVLVPHSELTDNDFLALEGYELDVNEAGDSFFDIKCCHMCFVALKPGTKQVCYHRSAYCFGNAINYRDGINFDESLPDYVREYTPQCVSDMMRIGRESGFFVTYNHPTWSQESYGDYVNYNNMHAMEIFNNISATDGFPEYNERVYDDMLRAGKRIYCLATDDNHNHRDDSFGGFTMIKAESLDYTAVTDALIKGYFYASQGPEIYSLYVEDGRIYITCSEARSIRMSTARRRAGVVFAREGESVTSACFDFLPEDKYVRLTVTDRDGKHANTNAYFTDEL
jgi:hypothetical protein